MERSAHRALWGSVSLVVAVVACAPGREGEMPAESERSPSAHVEIVEALREDLVRERSDADGEGRVWFDGAPGAATAGQAGSWAFIFEAGSRGVADGGWVFFQAPPFWGWSTPQTVVPEGLGFTTVETDAEGVELEPATVDQQLLATQIKGRALRAGERIRIVYGAGPAGAMSDRYAESRSCFFFAVDGDGDGIRSLLPERLCLEVTSGPAAQLVLSLPSTARLGDRVRLTAAVVDAVGNRVEEHCGSVVLEGPPGLLLPGELELRPGQGGAASAEIEIRRSGVFQVRGRSADGLVAESNPMLVSESSEKILWADLHGHSGLSDGTGTPRDYLRYARDVSALDVVALTDHDHWGMEPLALHPELWEEIRRETELHHQPGRFVTLLGYEWTNWIHGHRHVLFFSDHGEIYSSVDPEFESPLQLWDALRGRDVLTFAHHSAGGPIATNWSFAPDPELEPLTEIVSVHGSSEAADSPGRIYSPIAGNFVRDVLDRGYELGFVGSGDSHDGHPGRAHLNAVSGGLAAILSQELTRDGVLEAMRARRVYATNGPRIVLHAEIGDHPMGSALDARVLADSGSEQSELEVDAIAPGALERVDIVQSGGRIESVDCEQSRRCRFSRQIRRVRSGDYLYLRVVQQDGGAAWSSPFFFR